MQTPPLEVNKLSLLKHTLLVSLLAAATLLTPMAFAAKAVDFQFTDTMGKTLQLSDFKGKWVLVNFWAPWCPLCWAETPTLNNMNKRKDFVVIGIGLDYGPDASVVQSTAERHNMDVTAIVAGGSRRDPSSPLRQVGPVDFFPTSYLYDPTGEIVMFIPGQVRERKLLDFMENWNKKRGGGKK
jgi:thiol-disulfide isomerase/thioredoxin